jgi:1,4-dihydroxy-2-naphthoate octaprenyltransferase
MILLRGDQEGRTTPEQPRSKYLEQLHLPFPSKSRRWYDLVRILSLDVAFGALGGGCMAAKYLDQKMLWIWYVILPVAVWVIYTGDHLLDARRLGEHASTERHRFHHRHFWVLATLAGIGGMVCLVMALVFMTPTGLFFGFAMAGVVVIHLLMVRWVGERTSPWLVKEFGVAVAYALGIWGLPLIKSGQWQAAAGIIPMVQFLLLALVNLLEFSLFEFESDSKDGHTSFVRALGKRQSIRLIRMILGLVASLGVVLLLLDDRQSVVALEMIYALMAAMLAILLYRKAWFSQHERYRAWGDAAFFLPFLYLMFSW